MTSISAENSGQESSGDSWWWLAINGASCAACFFPVRAADLVVSPIPQELIGFHTRKSKYLFNGCCLRHRLRK
jgi:hypothetical protein